MSLIDKLHFVCFQALAFKEREIVASRKATKAAHKQAAEESLRIRLARLAQEQHAALQKEAPVLSAAGIVVSPAKPQSRAEDSKPEIKPGQRDQSQSEGGVSGASGYVGVEKSREAEQRRYHLEQIQQMLEKRLQGVEASAAVAERARVWLQGKAKELAQSGARFQDEREVRAFGQNDKDPASGCSKGTALGERNKAESRSGFKDSGSMTETKLTVESDAEDDDPLASQSPLPRSVVPKPITRSTTPPKSEASQRYGLEHVSEGRAVRGTHQDFVLSPMSSSGAFTSEDLQGVKAQAQSEIGSLVNEVGSELGVLSLEQSVTSDEEGWLIKNRNPRFAQGETLPDADTELSAHRSYSSQEVAMTSENLYEAEKAVNPSDSRSSIPAVTSCSLSGAATDGQNSEREDLSLRNELLVPHTSGDSSGGADVTAGGADVTTSGDDAHEGTGQEPRNRGGVRKREVFDEHGMVRRTRAPSVGVLRSLS